MKNNIDNYIEEFLLPTASSVEKLLAAWDGLSFERKVLIISFIKTDWEGSSILLKKIIKRIFADENNYIRYLIARNTYFDEEDEESLAFWKLIENDPSDLVKYSVFEREAHFSSNIDVEVFFERPHAARLAIARTQGGSGERMAKVIRGAIEGGLAKLGISEGDLVDILHEYVCSKPFQDFYHDEHDYDGHAEYQVGKDLEELWRLLPDVPIQMQLCLLKYLPENNGYSTFPEEVLSGLSEVLLSVLFDRKDVVLSDLRKKYFFSDEMDNRTDFSNPKYSGITYHFDLTDAEFAEVISSKNETNKQDIKAISFFATDIRLVLYEAVYDLLKDDTTIEYPVIELKRLQERMERRANELKGISEYMYNKQIVELKLYKLAAAALANDEEEIWLPSELEFLKENIIEGDVWASYMAFKIPWIRRGYTGQNLTKYLPSLPWWLEDEDYEEEEGDFEDEAENPTLIEIKQLQHQLKEKQTSTQTLLTWIFLLLVAIFIKLLFW